ncbi:hypothetical protein IPL85_00930 [Candidatus Saccharibacteria bacterium]|nr:MAG: hypothetical protein IPL85_00930 [Candidatus Saccharibacteria bacterium]
MSKKEPKLNPLTIPGYLFILLISFLTMPYLPRPTDPLGWGLVTAAYCLVVGLLGGGWWWLSSKFAGK